MLPKEFIKITFLDQLKDISYRYHYISFVLIGIGIEFLGKCLDDSVDWHQSNSANPHFDNAIKKLMPRYIGFNDKFELRNTLRNGLAHAFLPKVGIGFTNREEAKKYNNNHLDIKNDRLILIAEDFYDDFREACEKVIECDFDNNSKMNDDYLNVPQNCMRKF